MALSMGLLGGAGYVAPVAGPALDLLETATVSSSVGIVEFTGLISKYASDYRHLQLRISARSNRGSTVDSIGIRFNGVSSAIYAWHWIRGLNSGYTSAGVVSDTSIQACTMQGNNGIANRFGVSVNDILDPFASNKNTTIRSFDSFLDPGESAVHLTSGLYPSTNAVDTIGFVSRAGSSIVAGSEFRLYGMKVGA